MIKSTSDEALMLEFQSGSHPAFEQLYLRYRGPLYGFFQRRLHVYQRADDLTQETFMAVIRASAEYEQRALFRTYLYSIAMNLLAAERRKQFRDSPPGKTILEPAGDSVPEDALWIREALEKLDDSEREILMLREYEKLTYTEIADLLELPLNTVRSRLFRSRMALKAYLEPTRAISSVAENDAEDVNLTRAEGEAI
jgi:RNA polymerase sigma-70 factor (ECF subfamily)